MNQGIISSLRARITELSANPDFIHHEWFVKYHLEVVEQISKELCEIYTEADQALVMTLVWMHDYGKIIDFSNEKEATMQDGKGFLLNLGFDSAFSEKVIDYIKIFDAKENLQEAPIEIQIVSSADGASHLVGAFFKSYWRDMHHYGYDQLCEENIGKMEIDWNKKVVLPEVKEAFQGRYNYAKSLNNILPNKYLS